MNTKVIKLAGAESYPDRIRESARLLEVGGLVAFPTETVYGLGANAASAEAVERLRAIKQRPEAKPFTVHIGRRGDVKRFVGELGGVGHRLVEKGWPGPLTLIFTVPDVLATPIVQQFSRESAGRMYHEDTIGLRCPDQHHVADLLTETKVPVVAASANAAGQPPPTEAAHVLEALDGRIDLVLDGGQSQYGKPSTIVRVNGEGYEVLRHGVLDERMIRRLASMTFLFVCTGNTCRSPMAAAICRQMLAERLGCNVDELESRGFRCESAGAFALRDSPASGNAIEVTKTRGINISSHRSQALSVEMINRADHVLTMSGAHAETVVSMVPSAERKTRRLDETDIEDPIGGGLDVYAECARRIEDALRRRLEELTL